MRFSKYAIGFATALTLFSNPLFALTFALKGLSPLCSGQYSERIIESVNSCSEPDLKKAYLAITKLEAELAATKSNLESAIIDSARKNANSVNFEARTGFVAILATSGVTSSAMTDSKFRDSGAYSVEDAANANQTWGTEITLAMDETGALASDVDRRVTLDNNEIPKFREKIALIETQIKRRKFMLGSSIQLKIQSEKSKRNS